MWMGRNWQSVFESRMSLSPKPLTVPWCFQIPWLASAGLWPWWASLLCATPHSSLSPSSDSGTWGHPSIHPKASLDPSAPQMPSSVCLLQRPPHQLSPVTQQIKRFIFLSQVPKAQPVHLWLSLLARSHSHLFGKIHQGTRDWEREMYLKRNKITKQCVNSTEVNSKVKMQASRSFPQRKLEKGKISIIYYSKYLISSPPSLVGRIQHFLSQGKKWNKTSYSFFL